MQWPWSRFNKWLPIAVSFILSLRFNLSLKCSHQYNNHGNRQSGKFAMNSRLVVYLGIGNQNGPQEIRGIDGTRSFCTPIPRWNFFSLARIFIIQAPARASSNQPSTFDFEPGRRRRRCSSKCQTWARAHNFFNLLPHSRASSRKNGLEFSDQKWFKKFLKRNQNPIFGGTEHLLIKD